METINTYYKDYIGLKKFVNKHYDTFFANVNCELLIQVFCGIYNKDFMVDLSQQIYELLPKAQVIGTTTSGEIMNGLVSGLKTVLSFSVFHHTKIKASFATRGDKSDYQLGRTIATKLYSEKAKLLILFATGTTVNANEMLKGVQSVNAQLPVAGGNAGDNLSYKQGYVLCNGEVTDCGVVGVVLEGDCLMVNRYWHLGWQPIGKEMTVTSSDGFRIYTIDHMPTFQVYRKYLGVDCALDIRNVIEFPLIINRNGIDIARCPFFCYDDDSIIFLADIFEGEKVHFGFGHVEKIFEEVEKLVQITRRQSAESIFIYSCVCRRGFLHESAQIETLPFQEIAPTSGFFTGGEFFYTGNTVQLMNVTMTTLLLSESAGREIRRTGEDSLVFHEKMDSCSFIGNGEVKDNVATRSGEILKALTRLVDTVTKELNERTVELEMVNEKLKYASSHDSLTGLYNRGFFEQEMMRLETAYKDTVGIIICDVDALKLINDLLGHNSGDDILRATAGILKSLFCYDSVIARIGGDEFAVLLLNKSLEDVQDSCKMIREAVISYNYNKANLTIPLSLSIGCSLRNKATVEMIAVLKEADRNMYREKLHHSQNIHSDLMQTLEKALETRDFSAKKQDNRLKNLFIALAMEQGLPHRSVADLCLLARFRDIGKVAIPDYIIFKPGPLTIKEKKEIQRHCEIGYRITRSLTDFLPIADWILKHHEWWNGKGYPLGLVGQDIPIECRILAIVDAFDAMTSDRPYRKAMSSESAIKELKRCAGIQFDPTLIEKFLFLLDNGGWLR